MHEFRDHTVTQLLLSWRNGDEAALNELLPLVYKDLYRRAKFFMSREHPGHILQTTALINELYIRLVDESQVDWKSRNDFFAVCANLMRQILVDLARSIRAGKRGGGLCFVSLDEAIAISPNQSALLLALDDALSALAALNARQSRVVELRYFGGLTVEETAEVLNISVESVKRDWRLAKLWLLRELSRKETNDA